MSQRKLSGSARVLRVLRLGPTHQGEWFNPADGGKPITRLGARIYDLKAQGHKIRPSKRDGLAFEVYTLLEEAPGCKFALELQRAITAATAVHDIAASTELQPLPHRRADPHASGSGRPPAGVPGGAEEPLQLFDVRPESSAYRPEAA